MDGLGIRRLAWMAPPEVLLHRLEPAGIGLEREVERRLELALDRRAPDLRRHVVAEAAAGPVGVGDVAGRLLEIGHEAAPLEELREHVGDALAREVDPAQLGHRVVAILHEDTLEEALRPRDTGVARRQVPSVPAAAAPTNSSRNRRRRVLGERE